MEIKLFLITNDELELEKYRRKHSDALLGELK